MLKRRHWRDLHGSGPQEDSGSGSSSGTPKFAAVKALCHMLIWLALQRMGASQSPAQSPLVTRAWWTGGWRT